MAYAFYGIDEATYEATVLLIRLSSRADLTLAPSSGPGSAGASWASSGSLERIRTGSASAGASTRHALEELARRYGAEEQMTGPFMDIGGRRYLRDRTLPYPLPVDLTELHRQSLRTLTLIRVYGAPFCNPFFDEDTAPKKVLEVACGNALWSSACHDYFAKIGHPNVSFTGIDIAPLPPDLKQAGVDWRFIQHDMRKLPLPLPDEDFDFIFVKDVALNNVATGFEEKRTKELLRLLKPGGVMELWESNHQFRVLLPNPPIPLGTNDEELEQAEATATYIISQTTGFTATQNQYLAGINTWIERAFDKRNLVSLPCNSAAWAFTVMSDLFDSVGSRRVAIPFGEMRWEREGGGGPRSKGHGRGSSLPAAEKQVNAEPKILDKNQIGIRRATLLFTIQFVESLEPVLKAESGLQQDEWDRWWASLTSDLLEQNGTLDGECVEAGAWWAQRAS